MFSVLKGIYQVFRCIREFVVSLFFILFVLVCFSITALMNSESKEKKTTIPSGKMALTLNLDGYLADNQDDLTDLRRLLRSELGRQDSMKISTFDVVSSIRTAQDDDRITGLVLDLGYFEGGDMSSLNYIGSAIQDFKQSGKPVIAVGAGYSQSQYYLASFADEIYLNKAGFVDLRGLSYSNFYFKTLFDKLEAVPHIFRVGTYKSAVEPFLRDDMSPEARQNASSWVGTMWKNVSADIAQNRGIQADNVVLEPAQLLAEYRVAKGDDAQFALNQKLVTKLVTTNEMAKDLEAKFGKMRDGYRRIEFLDYMEMLSDRFNVRGKDKIAVINVEGAIIAGESDEANVGHETVVPLLRKAREDSNVKGVILRINSPGGSAMASELIRQEVDSLQQAGKPVVASMGGMAASGGYWIAATADKIVASPTTITGSIGIFGLAVTFEKTAKNLGVTEDGVATSPLAQLSGLKTLSKEQGDFIQIGIENGYERFLDLVARGRNMPKSEVDKVAQGQVWLGETAFEKGLVDRLGTFDDALDEIVKLTKLEDKNFKVQWFVEEDTSLFGQLARDFKLRSQFSLKNWFGIELPLLQKAQQEVGFLKQFNDPKQSYLYCLNCGVTR